MVEGSFRTRVRLLFVLLFVCSIERSNSNDSRLTTTNVPYHRHPGTLTSTQRNSAVTIEFNFRHIDPKNRTALDAAYREVRRKILEYLNSRRSTSVSPTHMIIIVTSIAPKTTAVAPTTTPATAVVDTRKEIPTTVAATARTTQATITMPTPIPAKRRRRRRNSGENNSTFTEENLPLVLADPEIENGILRVSFFLEEEDLDGLDLGKLLYEAVVALNATGELESAGGGPVVCIYSGLPSMGLPCMGLPSPMGTAHLAACRAWLPYLPVLSLLLIIFI